MKQDVEEQIPEYESIFRDESDSEEESEDEDGERRPKYDESSMTRRRERKEWEEQRHRILFAYNRDSYYGSSSALEMYELAWKMSRDSNDLLWWAIIGHTELHINVKIDSDRSVAISKMPAHINNNND